MVKLHPVKSLVPISGNESSATPRDDAPNRFRNQCYDRSIFGPDDCTKETGECSCFMCAPTPLVIVPSGDPICSQYNITLKNVQEYLDGGLLKTLHEQSFMIYRQTKCDGTCQIGIFAAIEVDDCAKRVVRPHENVTSKKDTTVLNKPKSIQPRSVYMDPVMLLYRERADVNLIVQKIVDHDQPHETVGSDEMHQIWTVKNPQDIAAIQHAFDNVEHLYIADGHHRAAAACRECDRLTSGRAVEVAQSARFLTALIFPDTHLSVLSYNRCVSAWPQGLTKEAFVEKLSSVFTVEQIEECNILSLTETETNKDKPSNGRLTPITNTNLSYFSDTTDGESRRSSGGSSPTLVEGELSTGTAVITCPLALLFPQEAHTPPGSLKSITATSPTAAPGFSFEEPAFERAASPVQVSMTVTAPQMQGSGLGLGLEEVPQVKQMQAPVQVQEQHVMYMYVAPVWYKLSAAVPCAVTSHTNPLQGVGCQILLDNVLRPLLQTEDVASGCNMVYVDGREGSSGVRHLVDGGQAVVGFLVSAVPAEHIMKVADAGQLLPAKATFFDPKPAPNLLLRLMR